MDGLHGVSFADFNPHLPQEMTRDYVYCVREKY